MNVIWATRGRDWGFRFLRDGGFPDPLPVYDRAFTGVQTGPVAFHKTGTAVAVRFPDPAGRKDAAGRPIPHELVVLPPEAEQIHTVQDVLDHVWPSLADEYEKVWDSTSK